MLCTEHSHLRDTWRCPHNPPIGQLGTIPFARVNACLDNDSVLWLSTKTQGLWFKAHAQHAWDFKPN